MEAMAGSTILITGATDGLGRGLALKLAAGDATLLLHGRDDARGQDAIEEIGRRTGNERLRWYRADFSSLDKVRHMALRIETEREALHVLINNAGIGTTLDGDQERKESDDGYELRFAVNYLAPFLLTRRLLPLLLRSGQARIVNVCSAGQSAIDFDDVMLERGYNGFQAYCQSKLAQVMFTFDLAEELRDSGVTANCLHPATYMPTKMVHAAGVSPTSTLEQGVRATLRLAIDPELDGVSGVYFDGEREAGAHAQAYDREARGRLRELSERLAGLRVEAG
jgi:NAD(P)-dependent dehydrogenase (short-subunit alcohol dehydrogenase family)